MKMGRINKGLISLLVTGLFFLPTKLSADSVLNKIPAKFRNYEKTAKLISEQDISQGGVVVRYKKYSLNDDGRVDVMEIYLGRRDLNNQKRINPNPFIYYLDTNNNGRIDEDDGFLVDYLQDRLNGNEEGTL